MIENHSGADRAGTGQCETADKVEEVNVSGSERVERADPPEHLPANLQLYLACRAGHQFMALAALNTQWADINLLQRKRTFNELKFTWVKNTYLHAACLSGNLGVVDLLCAFDVDANVTNRLLDTPLHCAVSGDNDLIVTKLIAINANVNAVNARGATPLHLATLHAAESDNKSVMLALLGAGAKILKDHSETTPLDIACFARDLNIIDSLLLNRDLLDIEGHVRTLFLVLKYGKTSVAIKLFKNVEGSSRRFELLVYVLQYAQTRKEDVKIVISTIKLLLEADCELLPGGIHSLVKKAEDLQIPDIVELVGRHEAAVAPSSLLSLASSPRDFQTCWGDNPDN